MTRTLRIALDRDKVLARSYGNNQVRRTTVEAVLPPADPSARHSARRITTTCLV